MAAALIGLALTLGAAAPAVASADAADAPGVVTPLVAAQAAEYENDQAEPRAYSSHPKDCVSFDRYGACVQPYGDLIWIKDGIKDGHGPYVSWTDMDGDRAGLCFDQQGVDAGWTACNKNFPEGHEIRWQLTLRNYDGTWESSAYRYTTV
ncbi:hypothetical protein ACFT2C_08595 [Promicromonospora sp. NPDC057138]|uniref:hypothetical protein n=1 Tax=Promicromonospora sp. NPDC057138 TaxID=3346031 RepID=UPI003632F5E1